MLAMDATHPTMTRIQGYVATCIHLAVENSWHPNTSLPTTCTEETTHPTVIRRNRSPERRLAHSSDHVTIQSSC